MSPNLGGSGHFHIEEPWAFCPFSWEPHAGPVGGRGRFHAGMFAQLLMQTEAFLVPWPLSHGLSAPVCPTESLVTQAGASSLLVSLLVSQLSLA